MDTSINLQSKNLQNYFKFLDNYNNILDITSETRNRSKNFIKKSYNQLKNSYDLLSEDEKLLVTLPMIEDLNDLEDDHPNSILNDTSLTGNVSYQYHEYEKRLYKNVNCPLQ